MPRTPQTPGALIRADLTLCPNSDRIGTSSQGFKKDPGRAKWDRARSSGKGSLLLGPLRSLARALRTKAGNGRGDQGSDTHSASEPYSAGPQCLMHTAPLQALQLWLMVPEHDGACPPEPQSAVGLPALLAAWPQPMGSQGQDCSARHPQHALPPPSPAASHNAQLPVGPQRALDSWNHPAQNPPRHSGHLTHGTERTGCIRRSLPWRAVHWTRVISCNENREGQGCSTQERHAPTWGLSLALSASYTPSSRFGPYWP
ncbi:hypothetical protein KIL84_003123 [Mauremys mutica]|uniref:Uncharacterized protein n=1 Tax=Mauremys mutica TaxID=74926 RepID=A0A9D4AT85_9SAUR|nr:hypothetical protein KIL84_003123 [Mauremys mutica]